MANIAELKQRLQAIQSKPSSNGGIDYKKVYWKPSVGKQVIRILPNKYDKENPFTEIQIHYGIGKNKMAALTNYGEKDPIIEFSEAIKKDDWKLSNKIKPKFRVFAQVVVRGEEEMGPRIWEFGKEVYAELLGIMTDEDYGDITDITKGRDITVDTLGPEDSGKKYNTSTLRPKVKETPISDDAKLVKSLISEQKDILGLQKKMSYDEMKVILKEFLDVDSESEEAPASKAPTKEVKKGAKVEAKPSEFDDLFDGEESETDED